MIELPAKPGVKTSEFWSANGAALAILFSQEAGVSVDGDLKAKLVAAIVITYIVARAAVKICTELKAGK